jgi:hypothetical protein
MISRAMLGLAAILIAAPLGSAATAADRLDGGMPSHAYAYHRHHAHAHFGHHRHFGHDRHFGHYGLGQRRLLYRNPAYAGRGWRVHQRWYAQASSPQAHYGWRVPLFRQAFASPASYAYPAAGSYVGGPRYGALYNQPTCWCR